MFLNIAIWRIAGETQRKKLIWLISFFSFKKLVSFSLWDDNDEAGEGKLLIFFSRKCLVISLFARRLCCLHCFHLESNQSSSSSHLRVLNRGSLFLLYVTMCFEKRMFEQHSFKKSMKTRWFGLLRTLLFTSQFSASKVK